MSPPAPGAGARHGDERIGLQASALALFAALLWGGNAVSIKLGLEGIPPIALAGFRFLLGLLVVGSAALWAGVSVRLQRAEGWGLAGLTALFVLQIVLLNQGTYFTIASRSTVLISTYPFFTALFAHFFIPGDRLNLTRLVGLMLSFVGVMLIFAESVALADTRYLRGDALVLCSSVCLGLRQVVIKRLVHGLHPFKVLFWQALLSLPVFGGLSVIFEDQAAGALTWRVAGAVLYQGLVVAGLCFILWVFLLQRHRASRLGVFGFVTPVFGVLLSALLLGEPLSAGLLLSVGLVAAGIAVVNREG